MFPSAYTAGNLLSEHPKSFKLGEREHREVRHYVFDLGLTAIASPSEKLLIQQCYEKCDIGKDDLGRQRVIDVRTDTPRRVRF